LERRGQSPFTAETPKEDYLNLPRRHRGTEKIEKRVSL
jgi:hypothetical protein